MTRGKKLAGLLAVLVLLVAATAVVRRLAAEEETVTADVPVMIIDTAGVTSLGWRYGDREYLFLREDGVWSYPADESFPVSATTMSALLDALNGMTAEKTMTEVTDLREYGLDDPLCVIEIGGDEARTVSMGGESAMGGNCYVTLDGSTVYMTDDGILSDFNVELYSMLRQESIPAMNNISAVTVERGKSVLELRCESDGEGNTVWHGLDGGEELLLDSDLLNGFLTDIRTLYWSDTVTHNADAKTLKACGLDQPRAVLTVVHTETTQTPTDLKDSDGNTIMDTVTEEKCFVLEIGDASDSGVYVRLQDSAMVYEITEGYANEILNIAYSDLLSTEE